MYAGKKRPVRAWQPCGHTLLDALGLPKRGQRRRSDLATRRD